MNTLTFYIVRFRARVGFVLLAATGRGGARWADLISVAVSVSIFVGLMLVVRSERARAPGGTAGGRGARRFRRRVDPEAWAAACVQFRVDVAARFRRGFPRSLLALSAMLVVDLMMLLMSLRFVGSTT